MMSSLRKVSIFVGYLDNFQPFGKVQHMRQTCDFYCQIFVQSFKFFKVTPINVKNVV